MEWTLTSEQVEKLMRGFDRVVDEVAGADEKKRAEAGRILQFASQRFSSDPTKKFADQLAKDAV